MARRIRGGRRLSWGLLIRTLHSGWAKMDFTCGPGPSGLQLDSNRAPCRRCVWTANLQDFRPVSVADRDSDRDSEVTGFNESMYINANVHRKVEARVRWKQTWRRSLNYANWFKPGKLSLVSFQKKAESTKHPSTVESLAMLDNCKTMSRPLCTPSGDRTVVLSPLIAINMDAAIMSEFSFETMLSLNISRSSETMLPNSFAASSTNGTRIESRLPSFGCLVLSREWK